MKNEEENLDRNLTHLAKKKELLSEDLKRGKKIAAGIIIKLAMKPIRQSTRRWRINAEDSILQELSTTFNSKVEELKVLKDENDKLENMNNNLLAENEDLRQTSMDGVEIANVI